MLTCAAASAGAIAVTVDEIADTAHVIQFTSGWSFSAADDILITALGYYDAGGDGLNTSHEVGIFSTGGTLLISAIVPSGITGDLVSNWRFTSIAPFFLPAGSYLIGGANTNDPYLFFANPTFAAGITLIDAGWVHIGGTFVFPGQNNPEAFYFNPNFRFEPASAAIPEPSMWFPTISS